MSRLGMTAWGVLLVSAISSYGAEPTPKMTGTVNLEKVEIRCGPAWTYPQTSLLKRGQQVTILEEIDHWFAIAPPTGSVSWINHKFIGKYDPALQGPQNAVVMKDNTAVHVGTEKDTPTESGTTMITDRCQVKLATGHIVAIVGPKVRHNDSFWYPITPPIGEVRYVPRAALANLQAVPATSSAKPGPSGVLVSKGVGDTNIVNPVANLSGASGATSARVNHPNWGEAELLQTQGRFRDAHDVYRQIYDDLKAKRADLDDLLTCLNRIDECKEKSKSPNGLPPSREGIRPSATIDPPHNRTSTQPPPPQVRRDWPTSKSEERVELTPSETGNLKSAGTGLLRRTSFFIDNKQAYALERENGGVLYYVTATPGLDLSGSIHKRVELLGNVVVRGDVRGAPYMVVSKVNPVK